MQKDYFIDYIQSPELGPCQPHNSFKRQNIVDMNQNCLSHFSYTRTAIKIILSSWRNERNQLLFLFLTHCTCSDVRVCKLNRIDLMTSLTSKFLCFSWKKKIKFNFNDLFFFLKRVNVLIISKHPSYMLFIITKSLDFCNNNISLVCHSSQFLCCYAGFCRTRPTHSFHSINLFINVLVSALQKKIVSLMALFITLH